MRAVLAGAVWPKDPHDFVGDENDILDELVADLDPAEESAAKRATLSLLGDADLHVRTRAVVALSWLARTINADEITSEVRSCRTLLEVAPAPIWKVRQPTLWAEALARLDSCGITMSAPESEPVWQTSEHFSTGDWNFVRRLSAQLTDDPNPDSVAEALAEFEPGPRNGLVAAVETEIRAVFGLYRSEWTEWRVRPEFEGLARGRLAELLVERLDSIVPGRPFTMPPPLFDSHLIALEVAGVRTPARELRRRDWDYIVAESTEPPGTYFVEFLRGSIGLYTEVKTLSPTDGAMVHDLSDSEVDRLVDNYR